VTSAPPRELRKELTRDTRSYHVMHAVRVVRVIRRRSPFDVKAGAALMLRSACTPAAVTVSQPVRSRNVSEGRQLTARSP
jgi:hypothetical protein